MGGNAENLPSVPDTGDSCTGREVFILGGKNSMIDLKFLRENPEIVKQNIKNKFQDKKLPLVDEVIALDEEARAAKQEADDLRASRNKLSKQIGALM